MFLLFPLSRYCVPPALLTSFLPLLYPSFSGPCCCMAEGMGSGRERRLFGDREVYSKSHLDEFIMPSDLSKVGTCSLFIFDFVFFGGILINLLNRISIPLKNYLILPWLLHAALQRFISLTLMSVVINLKQIMVAKPVESPQIL